MHHQPQGNRYDSMSYNRCGRSGLKLPALSLGLWHNFGNVDNSEIMENLIIRAFDLGITYFDLADDFGPPPGSAEENFGKIIKKHFSAYRDEMIISTKAGAPMQSGPYGKGGSRKHLLDSLDCSLHRLGLDHVDIFYSQGFDTETPLEETIGALETAIKSGKALYTGISRYSKEKTYKALEVFRKKSLPCLIHQSPYSLLERNLEEGLGNLLEQEKVGCAVTSPLAQGLLTDKYLEEIPEDSRAAKEHGFLQKEDITIKLVRKLNRLNDLAGERGQTLAQMAIAWNLRRPEVTTVLTGASKVQQLEDNAAALNNLEFSREELAAIDSILSDN